MKNTQSRMKIHLPSGLMVLVLCAALLLGSLIGVPSAKAAHTGFGFAPQQYKSGYTYGNGIYFAPFHFTVYKEPDLKSPVIGEFRWSHTTGTNQIEVAKPNGDRLGVAADRVFFCFYPDMDVAMLAVTGDNDEGWVEVIYDQAGQKEGWVKLREPATGEPAHFSAYQTWQEFMKMNAKPDGIYWLSGVSSYQRSVRMADADDAKLIPITIIRDLKVKHVRGNWLLVEVLDFERNTPIGWVRWRDDDGNLMVFPNLAGAHMPIVTTAF